MFKSIENKKKFLTFFLGILTISSFARARGYQPDSITPNCQKFINKIQNDYNYGWVQNHEILGDRRSQSIPIFYYYRKNSSLANPTVFFNGGPGFDSHTAYEDLEKSNNKFTNNSIDFIFLDQRGTGCSLGYYPQGIDDSTLRRLQAYGSEGIVNDAEVIRRTLLGPQTKWRVFGQSFGAMVVYRYIELFPQSIRSAHAHANVADIPDYQRNYNRVASEISVFGVWAKANPRDANRLRTLQKYLSDPNKCFVQELKNYCGFEILSPIISYLGFRHQWVYLSSILKTLVPIATVDENHISTFVADTNYKFGNYHSIEPVANLNYTTIFLNVSGKFDWDSSPVNSQTCSQILTAIALKNKTQINNLWPNTCSAPYQFNFFDPMSQFLDQKRNIIQPRFINISVVKNNILQFGISVYSYAGALDSFVPPTSFLSQNAQLATTIKYTLFPGSGHEGYFTESQVLKDLLK